MEDTGSYPRHLPGAKQNARYEEISKYWMKFLKSIYVDTLILPHGWNPRMLQHTHQSLAGLA